MPRCYRCGAEVTPQGGCECQDGITLVQGDCREVLPSLSHACFTSLITDPPYAITADFGNEIRTSVNGQPRGARRLQFDWDGPEAAAVVVTGLSRAIPTLSPTASCFVFVGFDTAERYAQPARDAGFTVKPAAWMKECPPPAGFNTWWPSGFELAYYGYRRGAYFADDDVKRCNVFVSDSYRHGQPGKNGHPTQKPIGLMSRIVEALVPPGGSCLDPFAGSGTLGAVCKQLGRRCLMVELEPRWVRVAAARMRQEVLFT